MQKKVASKLFFFYVHLIHLSSKYFLLKFLTLKQNVVTITNAGMGKNVYLIF